MALADFLQDNPHIVDCLLLQAGVIDFVHLNADLLKYVLQSVKSDPSRATRISFILVGIKRHQ
jgi:hypothetical protein